jgi:hypothetical protein
LEVAVKVWLIVKIPLTAVPVPFEAPEALVEACTQFRDALGTFELQVITALVPEQSERLGGLTVKVGVGLTVTVNVMLAPEQPFNVPLTEMVPA